MARTFDATTETIATTDVLTCPAAQGTVSLWIKPAWNSGDGVFRFLFKARLSSTPNNREWGIVRAADNNIYAGWVDFTAADFDELSVSDAGLFTSGTWGHWAMTWSDSADTIELFKNGSSIGTRTSALATYPAGTGYGHGIGNYPVSPTADVRGDLQEYALWSSVLSNADIAALSKGFSPSLISPSTLDVYLPLVGRQSPEIDIVSGAQFTVTGATVADHKGMFYPQAPMYPTVTTAAPAVTYAPANAIWF